ncbi:FAD:protein FMN transferase [Microbulbifer thermotolerans]|uniref:FAD:protein FMN transferase n=1 Tax=Microbulbifer thermotolerans TaxID=252514 RepID=UPI00224A542D|nr:FAD:protein FMN transferase [Microbulbifer thermotolerans]MCX2783609.1 FAD:protein FMN transferase [Microbulbifer thermotolerans]
MTRVFQYLLLCCALLPYATPSLAEWHYEKQAIMGTEVSVQLWHEDSQQAEQLIDQVMAEFRRLDDELSPFKPASELSRVNREAAKGAVKISAELTALIDKSLWYSDLTGGAFDISFATLGKHYDFRNKQRADEQLTESLLEALNYRHLHLDKNTHTLRFGHEKTKIDLGGIAKGYAVDRAVAILKAAGVCCASVSAGGDSRMIGDKRGRPWLVGIRHPRDKSKNAAVIPLTDTAISTSGDYERYFIDDSNTRVHHIFNPATGKPADTTAGSSDKLISVSIIGPRGFDTDPLSTSVFVLGKEKGLALIDRLPGFEAVVIDSNRRLYFSRGLDNPQSANANP